MEVDIFEGIDDEDPLELTPEEWSELTAVADAGGYRLVAEPARRIFGPPERAYLVWDDERSGRAGLDPTCLDVFVPFEPFGYRGNTQAPMYMKTGGGLSIPDAQFLGRYRQIYPDLMSSDFHEQIRKLLERDERSDFVPHVASLRDAAFTQLERCAERLTAPTSNGPGPLDGVAATLKVWLAEVEARSPGKFDAAVEYATRVWEALVRGWRGYETIMDEAATIVTALSALETCSAVSKATAFGLVTFIGARDSILKEADPIEIRWAAAERVLHAAFSGVSALPSLPDPLALISVRARTWYEFTRPIMFWLYELRNPLDFNSYAMAAEKIAKRLETRYGDLLRDRGLNADEFSERRLLDIRKFAQRELGMNDA